MYENTTVSVDKQLKPKLQLLINSKIDHMFKNNHFSKYIKTMCMFRSRFLLWDENTSRRESDTSFG